MGKGKIVLRTIWNLISLGLIISLIMSAIDATDFVLTAIFSTFLFPASILLLIYHIYTSVMYYIYCYKHRNDEVRFINKDKSKSKTILSTILLMGVAIFFMMYGMSFVVSFAESVADRTKAEEKLEFIQTEMSDYSLVENLELPTEKVMTMEYDYIFMSMYAVEGNLSVNEVTTQEEISAIRFEYAENLPWYVSSFIYNDVVDRLDTGWSFYTDTAEYTTTHNETKIDGVQVVYRYIQCSEANFINMCVKKDNRILYIAENWEQCVDMDAETRIDEWIEVFNNS